MKKSLLIIFSLLTVACQGWAGTDLSVRGSGRLFPIAVPQLCLQGGNSEATRDIPRIIGRDLDLSGYFEVLNPNSYIEAPGKCGPPDGVAYTDWTVIGAEGLVRGVVSGGPEGLKIQMYLLDVNKQQVVLGKEYSGDASQIPRIAHKFANEIMKFFTGEYGVFGTQIAFSSRVGRFKELFVMDMDGSNIRQLTNERGLAISPAWEPSGKRLVYTSYRTRTPDLFLIDVFSRAVRQVTHTPGMEVGAHFTPGGSNLIVSLTEDRDSDLVVLNTSGAVLQRLTPPNGAIDVSPSYSPDGSQMVFCSDRGGGPQIYMMGSDGSNPHRVSFATSNYCTSPRWSPKGDKIVFVCRADAGFNIFVSSPDGSKPFQLTSSGNNEDPDWSPDGRYITFATTMGRGAYSLALMRSDGSNIRQLTQSRGGDFQPAWGPPDL